MKPLFPEEAGHPGAEGLREREEPARMLERTVDHSRGGCWQGLHVISVLLGVLQAEFFSVIFNQVLLSTLLVNIF